jgi:hypothetical protein
MIGSRDILIVASRGMGWIKMGSDESKVTFLTRIVNMSTDRRKGMCWNLKRI